jgi:hypothetical protein
LALRYNEVAGGLSCERVYSNLTGDSLMKLLLFTLCFIGLESVISPALFAQPFAGQSAGGPVVSPYLNLTTNNSNGVSNYFTLVLPQIQQQQQQQTIQRQQSQIGQLQRQERAAASFAGNRGSNPIQTPQIRSTGHVTTFNNYSHYYFYTPVRRQQ